MPRVIRHGTADHLANVESGFSPNGESMFSRRSASVPNISTRGYVAKRKGARPTAEIIAHATSEMARLRGAMLIETNPTRLAKLKKSFEIKSRFVERLKAEQ
jgi:hypothetical protein